MLSKNCRVVFKVIAPPYPPENMIASYRTFALSKYLDSQRFDVEVITTKKYDFDGQQNLNLDTTGIKVSSFSYLPIFLTQGIFETFWRKFISFQYRFGGLFDPKFLWSFRVARYLAKSVKKSDQPVILFCTYIPIVTFFLGAFIKKRFKNKVLLILDFRDLWYKNQYHKVFRFINPIQFFIEKRLISVCDLVTVISHGMAEDIKKVHKVTPYVFFNGYINNCYFSNSAITNSKLRKEKFKIVYTGMLYAGKRNPEPLFKAIRNNFDQWKDLVEVHFYGAQEALLLPLIDKYGLENQIKVHSFQSSEKINEIQSSADCLLFLESDQVRGTLPGKLFEYLLVPRPILGIGITANTECGRLILDSVSGFVCGSDVKLIQDSLNQLILGDKSFDKNWNVIKFYDREVQVGLFQDKLLKVIQGF